MIISVLKEPAPERRIALVPRDVKDLIKLKVDQIWVEQAAGNLSFINDADFSIDGAGIKEINEILTASDVLIRINAPEGEQISKFRDGQVLIGQFNPLRNPELMVKLAEKKITCFSLDLMPRITRAQVMDVLSSMATVAGYKAALLAANHLPSFFPMFMTAAGTIKPARVLVIGAGVAGLQAISTSKRLGAVVEAFDVRSAAKEDVVSVGAKFIEVQGAKDDESAGGYAVEQSEEFLKKQAELIHEHAIKSNVIICTAQIPGKAAPLLIKKETVEQMKPGAVIVDLAAASGGNCEITENDKVISWNEVTVIGDSNLATTTPADASQMYSKNVSNFLKLLINEGELLINFDDEIISGTCVIHNGEIIHSGVKKAIEATAI